MRMSVSAYLSRSSKQRRVMARETWLSRMGANLNSSHLPPNWLRSLVSDPSPVKVVVAVVSGTTALPLKVVVGATLGSKMAAGGDMLSDGDKDQVDWTIPG